MAAQFGESLQQETAEILLEQDVIDAISRRGRRRLRDIQAACQAVLKLDRWRGVLQVTGTKSSIANVKKQLECLSGPTLEVSSAVWAELMRTRTNPDPTQAAVARIQQESGCRIHIQRDIQQVHLFGKKDETSIGVNLFKDFEQMCVEETVEMKCTSADVDVQLLQTFAQESAVTLQVGTGTQITVLGIEEAVAEAAKRLQNYDPSQQQQQLLKGATCDVARLAIGMAYGGSKFGLREDMSCASTTAPTTMDSLPQGSDAPQQGVKLSESALDGLVITKLPPVRKEQQKPVQPSQNLDDLIKVLGACPTCAASGQFCVNCGKKTIGYRLAGCQTCGTPKFCVYCGQPTERQLMAESQPKPPMTGAGQMTGHPAMPMRSSQQSTGYASQAQPMMRMPSHGSQVKMPEGMMGMPVYTSNGMVMMAAPSNGGQACMMQMMPTGNAHI